MNVVIRARRRIPAMEIPIAGARTLPLPPCGLPYAHKFPLPLRASVCTHLSRHSGAGRNPVDGDRKTSIYPVCLGFSCRRPSRSPSPQPFWTPAFAGETVPLRCVHTVALRERVGERGAVDAHVARATPLPRPLSRKGRAEELLAVIGANISKNSLIDRHGPHPYLSFHQGVLKPQIWCGIGVTYMSKPALLGSRKPVSGMVPCPAAPSAPRRTNSDCRGNILESGGCAGALPSDQQRHRHSCRCCTHQDLPIACFCTQSRPV